MKDYEIFETLFGAVSKPAPTKEKLYTKEEVEKLLASERERLCTEPRTIKLGSVFAAQRTLEGFGFVKASVSDYYKSETNETAHIEGGLTEATITITKL